MTPTIKMKRCLLIATLALVCGTVAAQRRHYFHPTHRVTTITVRPAVTVSLNQRVSQKERLQMAVAYLNNNPYLSIKQYARMTGLTKDIAEAELDAFAYDRAKPIIRVAVSKKKLYTLKG